MSAELRLLALYPEQMNIYADRGNILFLQRRCEWRGLGFRYEAAGPGDRIDAGKHDLIYIGGGQDRDQKLVAADMVGGRGDLDPLAWHQARRDRLRFETVGGEPVEPDRRGLLAERALGRDDLP